MTFFFIWLIVSFACLGLVMLCIKFAPSWDDEPLITCSSPSRQDKDPIPDQDSSQKRRQNPPQDFRRFSRSGGQVKKIDAGSKLANFAIVRIEDPLSRDVATDR